MELFFLFFIRLFTCRGWGSRLFFTSDCITFHPPQNDYQTCSARRGEICPLAKSVLRKSIYKYRSKYLIKTLYKQGRLTWADRRVACLLLRPPLSVLVNLIKTFFSHSPSPLRPVNRPTFSCDVAHTAAGKANSRRRSEEEKAVSKCVTGKFSRLFSFGFFFFRVAKSENNKQNIKKKLK